MLARTVRTVRLLTLNPGLICEWALVSTIRLGGWTRAWASVAHLLCGLSVATSRRAPRFVEGDVPAQFRAEVREGDAVRVMLADKPP